MSVIYVENLIVTSVCVGFCCFVFTLISKLDFHAFTYRIMIFHGSRCTRDHVFTSLFFVFHVSLFRKHFFTIVLVVFLFYLWVLICLLRFIIKIFSASVCLAELAKNNYYTFFFFFVLSGLFFF